MPSPEEKIYLHQLGKALFEEAGYCHIGMDHFSLPADELAIAWRQGRLHRNFMGYTTQSGGILLGLGVSAISDLETAYTQNDKTLANYYRGVFKGLLPITRGCLLTPEDQSFRRNILDIACTGATTFDARWPAQYALWTMPRLRELAKDGLVRLDSRGVELTEAGRPFLRHVCKAFDLQLLRDEQVRANLAIYGKQPVAPGFSNAI